MRVNAIHFHKVVTLVCFLLQLFEFEIHQGGKREISFLSKVIAQNGFHSYRFCGRMVEFRTIHNLWAHRTFVS